ncbi:MAG: hypothetical protein FWH05_03480, partial [Oscillospiraceae bacterium]|nr:hypothetical protein [Oscillospiraceae bacterium]
IHNDVWTVLDCVYDGKTVSFETDRFSTFALVYSFDENANSDLDNDTRPIDSGEGESSEKEKNPSTAVAILVTPALIAGGVLWGSRRRRTVDS